jgi:hypothetical protein
MCPHFTSAEIFAWMALMVVWKAPDWTPKVLMTISAIKRYRRDKGGYRLNWQGRSDDA